MKVSTQYKEVEKVVKVKEDVIVLELTKEEALILTAITGSIGGCHPWREKVVDTLYNELIKQLGTNEYTKFEEENDGAIVSDMFLKSHYKDS